MLDFKFPDIGEGIVQGEVVKWHVKVGDTVKADQILVDVETDKAVVNLPAPVAGTIAKIFVAEGKSVQVGEVLVRIAGKDENVSEAVHRSVGVVGELEEAPPDLEAPEHERFYFKDGHHAKTLKELVRLVQAISEEDFQHHVNAGKNDFASWIRYSLGNAEVADRVQNVRERDAILAVLTGKRAVRQGKALALPKVRKLAKEQGINLATIQGSGPGGRIIETDVSAQKSEAHIAKKYDLWGYVERVPVRGLRRTIAQRMTESWQKIPHVTHFDEADVTQLVKLQEKEKQLLAKQKIKLTFLPFVMKACLAGLQQFPFVNATFEGEEIVLKKYYNIGFAVATDDGLLVPVVKRVDQKDIPALAKELADLSEKARKRTVDLMDLRGGTFTITNIGGIGGIHFTPIINPPEVAILGTGKILERVVERRGTCETRKILPLSFSFDHRVMDGAYAAQFVNIVKKNLEDHNTRKKT